MASVRFSELLRGIHCLLSPCEHLARGALLRCFLISKRAMPCHVSVSESRATHLMGQLREVSTRTEREGDGCRAARAHFDRRRLVSVLLISNNIGVLSLMSVLPQTLSIKMRSHHQTQTPSACCRGAHSLLTSPCSQGRGELSPSLCASGMHFG